MYWTHSSGDAEQKTGIIYKSNMDGSNIKRLFESNTIMPAKLQLDAEDNIQLFFTDAKLTQESGPKIYRASFYCFNCYEVVKNITKCGGFEVKVPPTKGWKTCQNYTDSSYRPRSIIGMGVIKKKLYYAHDPDQFIRVCTKWKGSKCELLRYAPPDQVRMTGMGIFSIDGQPIKRKKNDCGVHGARCPNRVCVLKGMSSYTCLCPPGTTLRPLFHTCPGTWMSFKHEAKIPTIHKNTFNTYKRG